MSATRKSRRELLVGAVGGATVLAAQAIQRVPAAQAANGDPLVLGQVNDATAQTVLNGEFWVQAPANAAAITANGAAGVVASGTTSGAVIGYNATGQAIWAETQTGRALTGYATQPGGRALEAVGRSVFTRSGKATIAHPQRSVTVTVPGGLPSGGPGFTAPPPLVLATLQTDLAGVWVRAAVPNLANGTVTLHLNRAPGTSSAPKSVEVGWFIVN